MGKVYVVGNFKGGVGKTKTVTMLAYESAVHFEERTLVIDLDPQANATSVLAKTGNVNSIEKNITNGVLAGDLTDQITPIIPNLDLIAANTAFSRFPKILAGKFEDDIDQVTYLRKLIEPLKDLYDRIYLDVPPTISDYSDNAMMAANYCIVILQTQELSLEGAQTYIAYMQFLVDKYDSELQVLGIIPCMLRKGTRVDESIIERAHELYEGNVLNTIVRYQERLKVYDVEGMHMEKNKSGQTDMWDLKAHKVFIDVFNELDEHQEFLEGEG